MPSTAISPEPDVSLPRAVRERVNRVNERIRQRTETQEPAPTEPNPPSANEPAAVTPPEPPALAEPSPADPRELDPQYWKQRFNVTAGMLRREREERAREIEDRDRETAELRSELLALKSTAQAPEEIDISGFFTPEQIEQYGEDQCKTMVRAAMTAAKQQVQATVEAELKPMREREQKRAEKNEQQAARAFTEALSELVPDFEEIDASPEWHEWLAEEDPTAGVERQALLTHHVQRRDATRTAAMFQQFKKSKEPARQPAVAPTATAAPGSHVVRSGEPKKGAPTDAEIKDYHKRAATKRPGQPGYVTPEERAEFEERMRLRFQA